jgi:hypothetical protein
MNSFLRSAHILSKVQGRVCRCAQLSLAHNICKLPAIVIALAVPAAAVKSVGLPPPEMRAANRTDWGL